MITRPAAMILAVLISIPSLALAQTPDITVAADGSGNFTSIQKALESIPKTNRERKIVLIKDGVYKEKVRVDAPFVTLRGQSRKGTHIEYAQENDAFDANPDAIGAGVVNVMGSDFVLENLTAANTFNVVGPHEFVILAPGDRNVLLNCDLLSEGADTVALARRSTGHFYISGCNMRGAADFLCPRGWCYVTESTFFQVSGTAAVWHDGSKDKDMKLVLRNCKFDGVANWNLARHHNDGMFFFIDCSFSQSMIDKAPFRVIYPLNGGQPTDADKTRNAQLDKANLWGERSYYYNSHRYGGDYAWQANNLDKAAGSPKAEQITAKWTFAGTWDPEATAGPSIVGISTDGGKIQIKFSESVTVKGNPILKLADGTTAAYLDGSGSNALFFAGKGQVTSIDLADGFIIATGAAARVRAADLTLHIR